MSKTTEEMDCIENCKVIDKFHDDELALRKELAQRKESLRKCDEIFTQTCAELDDVKTGLKNSNQLCKDYNGMYQECKAERDRLRDALEEATNIIARVCVHVFDIKEPFGRVIHDDIEEILPKLEKLLEASKCECKSGRRGPNCHDYHSAPDREG